MEKFIIADGAEYKYKDGFSLNAINLEIYKEDITFVVGDNGCGKSTLSKLLCGINKPSTGDVWIDSTDTRNLSLSAIGKKIGYLWQNVDLQLFCIKVWDELLFKYKIENKLNDEISDKADNLLKTFKIDYIKNSNIENISKGEKQRLAIAVMLLNDNRFFILDEPTTGLDSECKAILEDSIKDMHSNGSGFLIISHDADFVSNLATRVIYMKKGGIENDKRLYC